MTPIDELTKEQEDYILLRENEFTTRQVAMLRTVEMLREELK